MAGQVFAIASGKGGVGKTTTVVNLGVVLRRADHSVALVDADLGMANLGPMLGVSADLTLHDVLSGRATVEDALVEEAPGFAVLAGSDSLTDYPAADPRNLGDVLETLAETYDFVLVDTGAGMSHEDVLPLGLADRVVLVASPDPAAIGDTRKTAELAGLARGAIAGLVVNKAESGTDAKHVASQVGVDLLGVVPYDAAVRQSTASGRPLEAIDPDTPAAAAYRELAGALADGSTDPLAETGEADPLAMDDGTTDAEDSGGTGTSADVDGAPTIGTDGAAESDAADTDQEGSADGTAGSASDDDPSEQAAAVESDAASEEADQPPADSDDVTEAEDEAPEPSSDDAGEAGSANVTADEASPPDEEDEEDPLAEFEDEPESTGGFLSRIGRIFR